MKRKLIVAILGISMLAPIASVHAQGNINLYNYDSLGPVANLITYGAGSGGTVGQGIAGPGWTVGMYVALGDIASTVNVSFSGVNYGIITGMGPQATGAGATTPLGDFLPGQYSSMVEYNTGFTGGSVVTVVVVAYNGANYDTSTLRGHSQAFTMTTSIAPEFAPLTGSFMDGFAIPAIPEPSVFALAGLGLAGLLIFRRRR